MCNPSNDLAQRFPGISASMVAAILGARAWWEELYREAAPAIIGDEIPTGLVIKFTPPPRYAIGERIGITHADGTVEHVTICGVDFNKGWQSNESDLHLTRYAQYLMDKHFPANNLPYTTLPLS